MKRKTKGITAQAMNDLKMGQNPKPTKTDISAQKLSTNRAERVRQLDYQAQEATELIVTDDGGQL
jgi:hypothetical protein